MEYDYIKCGDCLELMKKLPDKSIDLIITSPPYNIGKMHSNNLRFGSYDGNDMNENDYQIWQINFLNECFRVLKDNGSMFYNHKVRITNGLAIHPLQWVLKSNFLLKQEIVWNQKKSANCDKIRFFPFSERIYWLVKNQKTKLKNRLCLSDVWELVPTHKRKETGHIAVMPIDIVNNILTCFDENIIVLDPFLGSGTTAVACINTNRHYIGFEICQEYCDIAQKRINETTKKVEQMKLF